MARDLVDSVLARSFNGLSLFGLSVTRRGRSVVSLVEMERVSRGRSGSNRDGSRGSGSSSLYKGSSPTMASLGITLEIIRVCASRKRASIRPVIADAKLAGHPGGRKLYKTLRGYFYWPTMAVDCYAVAKNCTACARERVKLRKNTKEMKLFTPNAPLGVFAIDIPGELVTTKRDNRYILVISDRYSKLVRTVPLEKITAAHIAPAFVHHWLLIYGPPARLLSDNRTQFTTRCFQNICLILGIRNVFTTTYHPQANGQVETFDRTRLPRCEGMSKYT